MSAGIKRKISEPAGGNEKAKINKMHWSQGLKTAMSDPELLIYRDDNLVVIKDKYPKAKHHYLIMPTENIPNLKSLGKQHLSLLKQMKDKGISIAKDRSNDEIKFRCGFHAVPSMSHLHLHVISQDFDSVSLKTKKHWNSFNTEYFQDFEDIYKLLEEKGEIKLDAKKYEECLKRDLKCHVCGKSQSTMPTLKSHIKSHLKS